MPPTPSRTPAPRRDASIWPFCFVRCRCRALASRAAPTSGRSPSFYPLPDSAWFPVLPRPAHTLLCVGVRTESREGVSRPRNEPSGCSVPRQTLLSWLRQRATASVFRNGTRTRRLRSISQPKSCRQPRVPVSRRPTPQGRPAEMLEAVCSLLLRRWLRIPRSKPGGSAACWRSAGCSLRGNTTPGSREPPRPGEGSSHCAWSRRDGQNERPRSPLF